MGDCDLRVGLDFLFQLQGGSLIQTRLEEVKDLPLVGARRLGFYDSMILVPTPIELCVISAVPWNFGRSACIKIWFEMGLLMLPKSSIAVPMSEPAPSPPRHAHPLRYPGLHLQKGYPTHLWGAF